MKEVTFKTRPSGKRKTPRSAEENAAHARATFNRRPRCGSLATEHALRAPLPARVVPPAPAWMLKPAKPLGGLVKP
jgi:hypothetical protein